ncbi:hypothetical protein [Sapientia aquatica]|uniref:Uncharacterized protein n=1 Tax=Sapientia aquatica TaxID=1549640 RepID=A0A4R5W5M7_9BURK|nr:hypothetical protein [Sapientia aquatica]TDK68358.1 hypothetical protein E2I14_02110 [Sapientia aquatica]
MEPLKPSPQDRFLWQELIEELRRSRDICVELSELLQDRLFELNNSYKVMAEKQTTELLDKITK